MRRGWIVIVLIILLLVFILAQYGKCLMNTPGGNVVINMISDFFFVVVLAVLFGFLQQQMLAQAREFFGIDRQTPIQVYISTHKDDTTKTGSVMTTEEYEVADKLRSVLKKQFPGLIASWARLFGIDIDVPEIVIKGSSPNVETSSSDSLILVGGPTRNRLTEFYLNSGDPWVTFSDTEKIFIEKIGEEPTRLQDSEKLAILQKLVINGKVVIIAFGFGEVHTAAAVQHLAYEWRALAKKYRRKPFAQLLSLEDSGQVQVQEEYS